MTGPAWCFAAFAVLGWFLFTVVLAELDRRTVQRDRLAASLRTVRAQQAREDVAEAVSVSATGGADYYGAWTDEADAAITALLTALDGTDETAVSVITGLSKDELDDLGGTR